MDSIHPFIGNRIQNTDNERHSRYGYIWQRDRNRHGNWADQRDGIQLYHSSDCRRHGEPAKHCSNGNTAAAPSVTKAAADGQVTLIWQAVAGATSYKVYLGTNSNEILTGSTITATSAVVTGLTNDQTYSFWVAAVNSGESVQSAEVTATPEAPTAVPAAPNVTAAAGVNQVTLSWNAVASATSYKVYQNGTALAAVITTPSHTVTGLTAGTSYSFTVSAVNSVGEGAKSTAATAIPLPPAVTGLMATAGVEQVTLTWTASADTAVVAYVIRTTGGESSIADFAAAGRTTTSKTVTGLSIGVEYSFTIVAVAGSTESAPSDAVRATPTSR